MAALVFDRVAEPYAHRRAPATRLHTRWWFSRRRQIVAVDVAAVGSALVVGGALAANQVAAGSPAGWGVGGAALATAALWMVMLGVTRSRDKRVVAVGSDEYVRVAKATAWVFGLLSTVGFVFEFESLRTLVLAALPLGFALLMTGRTAMRILVRADRQRGVGTVATLVVGSRSGAELGVRVLNTARSAPYRPVGVCVPGAVANAAAATHAGLEVCGGVDNVIDTVRDRGFDAVAVTISDDTPPDYVRELGWRLREIGVELVSISAAAGVSSARVLVTPVDGERLVHIDTEPRGLLDEPLKRMLDVVVGFLALTVVSPVLLVTALAVKMTSAGPVVFKQTRIGRDGSPFTIYKFRSMAKGAEARLSQVLGGAPGLFYKPTNDPRVTRVGKVIRRLSIDELPQLYNVLKGDMSLVGPRPQVDFEVAQYDDITARRLAVKPGLTGLWQVSGRNNLTPEEGIRHDLFYVDNWSFIGDLIILARTFRAVTAASGAR